MAHITKKIVLFILCITITLTFSGCPSSGTGHLAKKEKGMSVQEKMNITKEVIENFFKKEGFSPDVQIKDLDGNKKPDFVVDISAPDRIFHWEDGIILLSGAICGCKTQLDFALDKIFLMNNEEVRMIDAATFTECCSLLNAADPDEAKTGECLDNGFRVME